MSMKAIAKFYERFQEDKSLQEQMKEVKNHEEFIDFAKGQGFDFTAEELDTFRIEQTEKAVPLSDDELDKAAGGFYNEDGYMITTLAYGCSNWEAAPPWLMWLAVKGQCGSCYYWDGRVCHNQNNMRK